MKREVLQGGDTECAKALRVRGHGRSKINGRCGREKKREGHNVN